MQPGSYRPVIISFRLEHLLGWFVTFVLCFIPVVLWAQIHPLSSIHSFPAIMLNLGRVTGLIGMVLYSLNLVYATRLKFLEMFFGGLNRVYIAHHLLGGFALIFLSFHPLLLALRYIQVSFKQSALLLLPNGLTPISALFNTKVDLHSVVLQQWAVFFGFLAFWLMVALLLVTFFIRLPYHVWLITHKFLGLAFFLASLHVLFVNSDTTSHLVLKYYILTFAVIGLLAFTYRTLMGKILIRRYNYSIAKVSVAGGNVTELELSPLKQPISYKAGQFVFIRFLGAGKDHIGKEWHPFSIASAPKDNYLQLSVKALGDYTNVLSHLKKGETAEIEGAYGKFSYVNYKNPNQIWSAGGIGVTPFISMARDLPPSGYKVDLYYSVKSLSEIIDWDKLHEAATLTGGNFRIFTHVADIQKGYLTADYVEKTSGGLIGKDIYICGPPAMMKSLRQQLKRKSIPGTSIHSEEFAMT